MPRSTRTTGGRHLSLTESVTQYPVENGRTYHRYHEGSYVYPNDEREMDRLDMQHHMCKMLTGGRLFFAPLRDPRHIVDIGTGSGIWPIELASVFPHAQITGTDLSPCQPDEVPENVHFIVDDCTEDEWLWNHNSLDYIHSGHLSGALSSYKDLLRKMFSHLKPGGWTECHEFDTMVRCDDGTMPPLTDEIGSYPFQDWCDLQISSGHATDPPRQFRVAHRIARGMRDVGFVDVQEHIFKAPVNPWSSDPHLREIGRWNESNILDALSGWSYKPLTTLSWSKPEIEVFLVQVRQSVQDRRVHAYLNFHVKCAYRNTSFSFSNPITEHVWISDELLASTFRRFTNGQRRYESRVPGPLEARRRLAKRKNTALASVAGTGPFDDIACLFGRDGREHLKWTNGQERTPDDRLPLNYATQPQSTYNENLSSTDWANPLFSSPIVRNQDEGVALGRPIGQQLKKYRTVRDLKDAVRSLNIDLRREPKYSRLMLDNLMSRYVKRRAYGTEVALFLNDPHLNVPAAQNFLGCVEHHISAGLPLTYMNPTVYALRRGLELGLVPPEDIRAILEKIFIPVNRNRKDKNKLWAALKTYQAMWVAITKCEVYGPKDLDEAIVETWLGILLETGESTYHNLARAIMLGTNRTMSNLWMPKFVTRALEKCMELKGERHGEHIVRFLQPFDADLVSHSIISVTEDLVSSQRKDLVERWTSWVAKLRDAATLSTSPAWTHIRVLHNSTSHLAPMSPRHRILQRLWAVHVMNSWAATGAALTTITQLYRLYDSARRDNEEEDLWTTLTEDINDLGLPFNLQKLANDLKRSNKSANVAQRALRLYESSLRSFADMFANLHAYNVGRHTYFRHMELVIRQMDVTSAAFFKHALNVARTGDTYSVWTLIRILRAHTHLKIAISHSWNRPGGEDPDAPPRPADQPDPHDSLEIVHALATAFACSEQLSPRRAFKLVRWLYLFLNKHGAPIRPPLVRALYHAGVVRFRREGRHLSSEQYNYIWSVVRKVEQPELVASMMEADKDPQY
ncbi:class I SAM-dependent methyltransferase [Aspergillus lucknowensis]|uniref:Methyltransferase domain-containing protein n=1 Tax=Aspergillus lucknowensis TaxID=176173 RepID=A0ABR4M1U1_9EURO